MKLSISFLVSFILLSSHLNFADAKKAGKEARKKHAENVINNLFDDDEDDYVIVFKKGYKHEKTEAAALTRNANGKLYKDTSGGFSGRFNSQAIGELKNNPNVAYIEKDVQVSINVDCTIQNNPVPSWGLDRIDSSNLDSKYSYDVNGPDQEVHVYVIDTGINSGHNDFVGRRLGEHFGAVGNVAETSDGTFTSGSWEDCNGHGTHVAGTVGGTQYGVAKNANIILHAVRVLNCDGMGYVSDIMEAYDWVIDQCTNKICVANGSFGGGFSQAGNDGAASLVEAGIVFAVAAGNGNSDACTATPASAEGVITVGATTKTDVRSSFSNHGECVDIFAPVRMKVDIFCIAFRFF
jgi:subtilisin family serine protease